MSRKNSRKWSVWDTEDGAIQDMKAAIQAYLNSGDGVDAVRDFLKEASEDDTLLLRFLKGRKFRPKHAWATLKRYAEVRFQVYPEMFPSKCPKEAGWLINENAIGILKARDDEGRRIVYFDGKKWDTSKYNMDLFNMMGAHFAERLIMDEDCTNNGCIYIQECSGMGLKHAREYTLSNMLRFLDIFWYACPLRPKALYFVNVPYFLTFIYGVIKPFLPKKLKERISITSTSRNLKDLHQHFSPEILPKCLGGKLEPDEANDLEVMNFFR